MRKNHFEEEIKTISYFRKKESQCLRQGECAVIKCSEERKSCRVLMTKELPLRGRGKEVRYAPVSDHAGSGGPQEDFECTKNRRKKKLIYIFEKSF